MSYSPLDEQDQNATPTQVPMRPPDTTTQPPMRPPTDAVPTSVASQQPLGNNPPTPIPVKVKGPSLFDRALVAMTGGERTVTKPDPNDPTKMLQVAVPAKRATLGQHILAGVISGVFAGMSKASQTPEGPAGSMAAKNFAAAGAGYGAAEQSRQQFHNMPQQQYDQMKNRAQATLKSNLELRTLMLNNARLDEEHRTKVVEDNKPLVEAINDSDVQNKEADPSKRLVAARGLTAEQAMAHGQNVWIGKNAIVDNYIPTGRKNADGTDEYEPTYTIINPYAKVMLTDALKAEYGDDYPALKQVSDNALVDARWLVQLQNNNIHGINAQGAFQRFVDSNAALSGDTDKHPVDFKTQVLDKIPFSQRMNARKEMEAIAGLPPDKAIQRMRADKVDPTIIDAVLNAAGNYDEDAWADHRKEQQEVLKKRVQLSYDYSKEQMKPITLQNAFDIANDPAQPAFMQTRARGVIQANEAYKAFNKRQEERISQDIKQGDPNETGRLLANGSITLSQVKTRGATPDFVTKAVNAAIAYSGNPNWNAQTGESQFKVAANPTQNLFFGSANSLIAQGGTLDQLKKIHSSLNNFDIPAFNKVDDYAQYMLGHPEMAGFMQTALGVADDYAKVMGGGAGGSDTARMELLNSFSNAHNDQQMDAAISAARNAVDSQVKERIGKNPILGEMYGYGLGNHANLPHVPITPKANAPQPLRTPAAKGVNMVDAKGNVVGISYDGGKTYVPNKK